MVKSLLCLGDSLTAGYGGRYEDCWTRLLSRRTGIMINNQGICGDTLEGMLRRLNGALASKPEACLLIGGTNDIFMGWAPDRNAVREIVAICRNKGVTPLLGTPVPIDTATITAQWAACVDPLRSPRMLSDYVCWLREFCRSEGIILADIYAAIEAHGCDGLYVDGVHMSQTGNEIIADTVEKMLQRI